MRRTVPLAPAASMSASVELAAVSFMEFAGFWLAA